ncbi:FAD-NAD(P)-binding [Nakamurella panacisegetis]|uniref:FAD-NAD(P)-binding n=1 Tax=Nakamurella panacisegetis TaxID=1090615 RepID=A0A1H0NJS9_9ACTN|nr:FAD-NAD(P)-binding [Nakamurella panacisegetis]
MLVFVGGGPRTVSLLERLAANAGSLLPASGLDIHIVDPFPVGGGRIWRRSQSPLLWMNSVAKDVTMFTDESVECEGPIVPGPPLDEWVAGPGGAILGDAGLGEVADTFTANDFASREMASLYLSWTFDRVVASFPDSVNVTTHRQRAVIVEDVATDDATQRVQLEDGRELVADLVVLAQGYLDRRPTAEETALTVAAEAGGLAYLPPGYTADIDLAGLRPGQSVLVRGFGLAFVDLMVLVFQGRGGEFVERGDGTLDYRAGGAEPVLYVGSRRGVPYHAKLGYRLESSMPIPPTYFTPAAVAALAEDGTASFATEIWPLIVKELTAAHYRRLFAAHADRTIGSWARFESELGRLDASGPEFAAIVTHAVPDPADRFDMDLIDRPLRGRTFHDRDDLSAALVDYVQGDLARRTDPRQSADHAVFNALLTVYFVLAGAVVAGRISAPDRVRYLEGEFHGLFSFLASGPPPRRLAELLALHRAGLVQFAGPDLSVTVRDGRFVGTSPAVPGEIVADALVDARLPKPDVRAASDPVISALLADGELAVEDLRADDGTDLGGGQLLADAGCHAVRADRTVHPSRFLLGPSVSGSAGSAGFARPGFNGAGFRQNDAVAREILQLAAAASRPHVSGSIRLPEPGRSARPAPARPANRTPSSHPNPHPSRIEISHAR